MPSPTFLSVSFSATKTRYDEVSFSTLHFSIQASLDEVSFSTHSFSIQAKHRQGDSFLSSINMAHKPVRENPRASSIAISAENRKQPTIQEKKAALREVPDSTKPAEAPVLSKDKISTSDSSTNKMAGTKRPNPSSPSSPLTYTYVRRKLETEQGNTHSSPVTKDEATKGQNVQNSQEAQGVQILQNSQESQNLQISKDSQNLCKGDVTEAAKPQHGPKLNVCKGAKPQNESHEDANKATVLQHGEVIEDTKQQNVSKGEPNEATKPQSGPKGEIREATKPQNGTKGEASEATKSVSSSLTASQDWKERFIRLQAFLKNCDQSNQEDYIQMLRSLSAVGRSKHAVDLEKRAIHLLLEEGKELHRMKVLNVLGKGAPSDLSLYPSQLASPPTRLQLQR